MNPSPCPTWAVRIYKLLLLAYPSEFRQMYGLEAQRLFAAVYRDTKIRTGMPGIFKLLARSAWEVTYFGIKVKVGSFEGRKK